MTLTTSGVIAPWGAPEDARESAVWCRPMEAAFSSVRISSVRPRGRSSMSSRQDNAGPLFGDRTIRREQIVARFEDAWQRESRPAIDDFLASQGDERQAILAELVHVDIEYRAKAGEPVRIEEYLVRFPELTRDEDVALELIHAEYMLRTRSEKDLTVDQYVQRFPRFREQLVRRLPTAFGSRPGRPVSATICCPDCRQPVPDAHVSRGSITCPACGSTFRLEIDETLAGSAEKSPGAEAAIQRPSERKTIGKFEILKVVGQGAFGTVYRARDGELDRVVALKVPRSGTFADRDEEDRFIREARSAAQLHHPGIVPVYEVGRADSFAYLVSQFVEGTTLADALSNRRFTFRQSAELVAQVADALDHSHRHGVIHRDLKPANIMLEPVEGVEGRESRAEGQTRAAEGEAS
ncbi:MAG: serine/threonine protein kinase, partial [Planctomycetes bacterium]|nr:serine/threonine protein kinase [Planctomycetota bacterium]